ncbi:unnamed protein product, partial [Rotaria sordida]
MNLNELDKNILIRRILKHFRDQSEKDKPLYEYESILIEIIKCNKRFSSIDVTDEIIKNEINKKYYCQLFTKLQHNKQTVYELNSCYQIRLALDKEIIDEDDCNNGCKIWEIQKKLNASLRHSKKILKLSIDSITDLPEPNTIWIYDSNELDSNLSFQSAIRIVDRFIHHPIMQKLFVPFSVQTSLYEYKLLEHAGENMTVERTKNVAVLLAIKILHGIVHWLFYHLVSKLNGNMDTSSISIQRAENGNNFENLLCNFIMGHEKDTATFRVNHLIGRSYDFFFNVPNAWRDQLLSNDYWTNHIIDEKAFLIPFEICELRRWGSNIDKSSLFFQLKSCHVSENQAPIGVEPITLVLNETSTDDDDDDDDGRCRVFCQKNSCK